MFGDKLGGKAIRAIATEALGLFAWMKRAEGRSILLCVGEERGTLDAE